MYPVIRDSSLRIVQVKGSGQNGKPLRKKPGSQSEVYQTCRLSILRMLMHRIQNMDIRIERLVGANQPGVPQSGFQVIIDNLPRWQHVQILNFHHAAQKVSKIFTV